MANPRFRLALHAMFGLVWFCISAYAQTSTATLTGSVRDATGAYIPGVTITVTEAARNTSLSTVSNDIGTYAIPVLNPGAYTLTAELPGFKRFVQSGLQLQVAQVARIDLMLEIGESSQSLEVSATTPVLETET